MKSVDSVDKMLRGGAFVQAGVILWLTQVCKAGFCETKRILCRPKMTNDRWIKEVSVICAQISIQRKIVR